MADKQDTIFAERLAREAGRILVELRETSALQGKELGKEGDQLANAYLIEALKQERPNDGILSEEEQDNAERLGKERVWIIDPLDGTREYGEGRDDWAVHVALAINGKAHLGAVALPSFDQTLTSDNVSQQAENAKLKMVVSRSRPAAEAIAVAEKLSAELLPMGSAGAKAMAVVRGEADIYLHSGGQYEWDNCAPVAVAQAAGLHCSRLDGSALTYNNENTWLPDLLICHRKRACEILDEL